MARKPQPYQLYPRGKKRIYWIRYSTPDGKRVHQSTGTSDRALATEWASRVVSDEYRVSRLGDKPRRLWTEAVTAWLEDHGHKRSLKKDIHNLKWLDEHFRDKYLDEITSDLLATVERLRKAEPRDKRRRKDGTAYTDQPTSQSTVDKMLALIRSILRDAVRRAWLPSAPTIKLKGDAHGEEDYRWLTKDEAARLHKTLAEHLRPPYRFSLATGWREQNVLRLEWNRVDLDRKVAWFNGAQAKGKRAVGAPLNRDAVAILEGQRGKHPRWVFPNEDGQPYRRANNTGFQAAQVRAGIAPLRWHDLRHTWASWHVMAGTSLRALMELGGWRSYKSVLRYAHLSPEHLASDAARVEGAFLAAASDDSGPNLAQVKKQRA